MEYLTEGIIGLTGLVFANFAINISASSGLYLIHDGADFLCGFVEPDFPLLLEYLLDIFFYLVSLVRI